jgi:hypothetical protein
MKRSYNGFWNSNCFYTTILVKLNWNEATRWFIGSIGLCASFKHYDIILMKFAKNT